MQTQPDLGLLDIDLSFLEKITMKERIPVLKKLLDPFVSSVVEEAMLLYYADIDDFARFIDSAEVNHAKRKKQFIQEHLPRLVGKHRSTISDHLKAGQSAVLYMKELTEAGVDLFDDKITKKLIALPLAIKTHVHIKEVFQQFSMLEKDGFISYAKGSNASSIVPQNPLWSFFNAYSNQ